MKLVHFGKNTLGSPQDIANLVDQVSGQQQVCLVVAPLTGVYEQLTKILRDRDSGRNRVSEGRMRGLISYHVAFAEVLLPRGEPREDLIRDMETIGENLIHGIDRKVGFELEALMLDTATHWSSLLVYHILLTYGSKAGLLLSRSFMRLTSEGEPDVSHTRYLFDEFNDSREFDYLVLQGGSLLGMDSLPHALESGPAGTAAAFALALGIPQLDVWHNQLPVKNNDPHYVSESESVRELTFSEASEIHQCSIPVLHPQAIGWLDKLRVSIYLRSTLDQDDEGLLISDRHELKERHVKMIRSRGNIVHIRLRLPDGGGLEKLYEVQKLLHQYAIATESTTFSQGVISIIVLQHRYLFDAIEHFNEWGGVDCSQNLCLVEVIGHDLINSRWVSSKLVESLNGIPFHLISAGESDHRMRVVIDNQYRTEGLNQLHHCFFQQQREPVAWLN